MGLILPEFIIGQTLVLNSSAIRDFAKSDWGRKVDPVTFNLLIIISEKFISLRAPSKKGDLY